MKRILSVVSVFVLAILLSFPGKPAMAQTFPLDFTLSGFYDELSGLVYVDINAVVDAISPGLQGATVYLGYDNNMVEYQSATDGDFFPSMFMSPSVVDYPYPDGCTPISAYPSPMEPPCVEVDIVADPGHSLSGTSGVFQYLTFNTVPGAESGDACFEILQVLASDSGMNGVNANLPVAETCIPIIPIDPPQPNGTILRQGTSSGYLDCTEVGAYTTATSTTPVDSLFTDDTGYFEWVTPLTAGSYYFKASYPGYLTAMKYATVSSTNQNLGTTTLYGGDIGDLNIELTNYGDGKINIIDAGRVLAKWGSTGLDITNRTTCDPDTDEPADINDDTVVNIFDLAVIAANFGMVSPTTWP